MTRKKKVALELSGTFGGARGAVRFDGDGNIGLQFSIEQEKKRVKKK